MKLTVNPQDRWRVFVGLTVNSTGLNGTQENSHYFRAESQLIQVLGWRAIQTGLLGFYIGPRALASLSAPGG